MPAFDALSRRLGLLAAILGTYAASVYWRAGLSLSHYDAKAHLTVARRVLDSLTPSWEQIGAVWLPLPHLLNALPVQIDWLYRTGASAIAMSIVCYAITTASLAQLIRTITGSWTGAVLGAALFALNPNVLYLQSTPMTEPLLFALSTLVLLHLAQWVMAADIDIRPAAGWTIVAACLTRYEAWPIVGAAMAIAAWVKWYRGAPVEGVVRAIAWLAIYPAVTVIFFLGLSFATTGQWFVSGGFYVADPKLLGQPAAVWAEIRNGLVGLAGQRFVSAVSIAVGVIALAAALRKQWSAMLLPLALLAAIALPFYAFHSGHPFRIRYEVPLILGGAAAIGTAVSLLGWMAPLVAMPLAVMIQLQTPFMSELSPMLIEAQLDRVNSAGRQSVTTCLQGSYDDTTIMASMGSLAHYMQELSHAGFNLDDFLHEGSGPIWQRAYYYEPSAFAGWVMIEEAAEGGDMLHQRHTAWPGFLERYDRVCEGGNVGLYRRKSGTPASIR